MTYSKKIVLTHFSLIGFFCIFSLSAVNAQEKPSITLTEKNVTQFMENFSFYENTWQAMITDEAYKAASRKIFDQNIAVKKPFLSQTVSGVMIPLLHELRPVHNYRQIDQIS